MDQVSLEGYTGNGFYAGNGSLREGDPGGCIPFGTFGVLLYVQILHSQKIGKISF